MNKKKLVISMLIVIMVLSLSLTALVGCKNDGDGYIEMTTKLSDALSSALYNTAEDNYVNNLKASAQLNVKTTYGETENEYTIRFGANAALNTADNNTTKFGLSIVDKKANANILNVYYAETPAAADSTDKLGRGNVYVDLGNGDKAQHFSIKGLSIKTVLKNQDKNVSDDEAGKINTQVPDAIDGILSYLDMVVDMASSEKESALKQAEDGSEIKLSIDLGKILEKAGSILSVIDPITTEKLGLALTSTNLASTLPALTVSLHFKMSGAQANNYANAKIIGVEAKLDVKNKDMVIKRSDDSTFVRLNIAKDFKADVDLGFIFGENASAAPTPLVANSEYTSINAINFTTEGELTLNKAIGVNINFNNKEIPLVIPVGTYSIKLGADIDPTQLIGLSFNAKKTSEILTLVETIATKAIKTVYIKINNTTDTTKNLDVSIKNGNVYLTDLSLIGELGTAISGIISNGANISQVINAIKPMLPPDKEDPTPGSGETPSGGATETPSGNGSGETPSGGNNTDKEEFDFAPIASLIKNLTVLVTDGKIDVTVNNHTVAENIWKVTETVTDPENPDKTIEKPVKDKETGKQIEKDLGDTTIDVNAVASKDGITIDASIKNIVIDATKAGKAEAGSTAGRFNVAAKVEVSKDGVITVTAKSADKLTSEAAEIDFGSGIKMTIDLVLKLTKFEIGNCK